MISGLSQTLHAETSPLGLRSICFEPGYFRTAFLQEGHVQPYKPRIADYEEMSKERYEFHRGKLIEWNFTFRLWLNFNIILAYSGKQLGDPKKLVSVVLDFVRQEGVAQGREIPLTLPLGGDCLGVVRNTLSRTTKTLEDWEDVIQGTAFSDEN